MISLAIIFNMHVIKTEYINQSGEIMKKLD